MFNLGIAHLYGYAVSGAEGGRDIPLAVEWLKACGLAEGYEAVSMYRLRYMPATVRYGPSAR